MKLIIAEKPSLARNIAGAIGNMKKHPTRIVLYRFVLGKILIF